MSIKTVELVFPMQGKKTREREINEWKEKQRKKIEIREERKKFQDTVERCDRKNIRDDSLSKNPLRIDHFSCLFNSSNGEAKELNVRELDVKKCTADPCAL